LEFGINMACLWDDVTSIVPNETLLSFHAALDGLIDSGAAVPRYMEKREDGKSVWTRVFRAGEGTKTEKIYAMQLLFSKLAVEIGRRHDLTGPLVPATEIPATLLEKFTVMAMMPSRNASLHPFRNFGLRKGFHLFGARPYVLVRDRKKWFVEWAKNRHVLMQKGTGRDNTYGLNTGLSEIYPPHESKIGEDTADAVTDLARFAALLHSKAGMRTDALVLITTVATPRDLHYALEAELDLWLNDENASITHVTQYLGALANEARAGRPVEDRLSSVDRILGSNALTTAQAKKKNGLFDKREELFAAISKVVADSDDELIRRAWRDVKQGIDDRVSDERDTSGLGQIQGALVVAAKLTLVLRDLLVVAGLKSEHSRPLHETVLELRELLLEGTVRGTQVVDEVVLGHLRSADQVNVDELLGEIADAQGTLSFVEASDRLLVVARSVAESFESIFDRYGTLKEQQHSLGIEPPRYIVLWDVRGSSQLEKQDEENRLQEKRNERLRLANRRIEATLGKRIVAFSPDSVDDGNGFIAHKFRDVLVAFQIIRDAFGETKFRMGCDVNVNGALSYFSTLDGNRLTPEKGYYGGRAYEFAARTMSLFSELTKDPDRWKGASPPTEPVGSHLIVTEMAGRHAQGEVGLKWPKSLRPIPVEGQYLPRVKIAIPFDISLYEAD
jgi:hypothetical protein